MRGRKRLIATAAACAALVMALTAVAAPAESGAAKKGKKKTPVFRTKIFRSNLGAQIPDRGLGTDGYFGVLESWIRVGRAMGGRVVADVDAGFSISGPPSQLEDIDVYLRAPNGGFVMLARDHQGQPGNTSYGNGECRNGATRFSDETMNFLSDDAVATQPGEILSPWLAAVQPDGFPLSVLDGGKARGRWTLHVEDDLAGDTFTLHCWWVRIKARRGRAA
jgi:hypothetical protein